MSHTVVRLTNAEVTSELKAEELSNKIKTELKNRGYELNDESIGDNTNIDGEVILRAVTDHVYTSEADSWANFLRKFVEANLTKNSEDGEGFTYAVVDEHDCQHMMGKDQPCKPVEWEFGSR